MVTAANKMRTGIPISTRVRFDNRLLETDCVDSRPEVIKHNLSEFSQFLDQISCARLPDEEVPMRHSQHTHFKDVSAKQVIKCLKNLNNHPSCGLWASSDLFIQYLESRSDAELKKWDVFVYQLKGEKEGTWVSPTGDVFRRMSRTVVTDDAKKPHNNYELRLNRKQRLTVGVVEDLGLTDEEIERVEQLEGGITNKNCRKFRSENNKNPSLHFSLVRVSTDKEDLISEETVLGWGISIPQSYADRPDIQWVVNKDWFEKYGTELTDEVEL